MSLFAFDFMDPPWWFFAIMAVALLALIGLLLYLRKQGSED